MVMWRGRGEGRPLPPRAPRLPRHRICAPMQSPEHHCFFPMCCSAAVPEPSTRSSCQLAGVPLGKPAADGVGRAPNGFLRLPPVLPTASWGRVPTGSRCAEPVKTQGLRVGSYGFLRVPTGGRFLRVPTGSFFGFRRVPTSRGVGTPSNSATRPTPCAAYPLAAHAA